MKESIPIKKMHSDKKMRERDRGGVNGRSESESNEIEELSSRSATADSIDHSRKSYKSGRQSSHLSRKHRRKDIDENTNYTSDIKHKKVVHKKKISKSGSRESIEDLSDETYKDDEDEEEDEKNKKRQKAKKRHENISQESTGERDSSTRKSSEKSKKKKRHKQDKSDELPITEILKKAQEQRTKYEEPVPLPELTTNTIYVQGKNGFSAVKIGGAGKQSRRSFEAPSISSTSRPIKVAIVFQKVCRSAGFIFQGLFGGMAMLHFIFMKTYFENSEGFVKNYSVLSEIYSSIFSFLIAMCIISIFDKFDVARINVDHIREIFKHHSSAILSVPLYIAAFAIHQTTMKIDDKLTLLHHDSSNISYYSVDISNNSQNEIEVDELETWQRMTLSKDALAVLGWMFVSLGNRKDMLLAHLETMNKYAENVNPSI